MRNIKDLTSDGFKLSERGDDLKDVALVSLKIALQAFFSTYKSVIHDFAVYKTGQQSGYSSVPSPDAYPPAFCEMNTEAIVHFQHFAELFFKEMLRADHDLLALNAFDKPTILHDLLHNQKVGPDEEQNIKTVEFSVASRRLYDLVEGKKLRNHRRLRFILDSKNALNELNFLRDRLWHRGIFILRYHALDEFVGRHILPFVEKVVVLPKYSKKQFLWKYNDLSCGIDPIQEIAEHFRSETYNICKIALLKELGRAAYVAGMFKPKQRMPFVDTGELRHLAEGVAAARAKAESESGDVVIEDIRNCPVCGMKTLLAYGEFHSYPFPTEYDEDTREPEPVWLTTYLVECTNCTFSISSGIGDPSSYGLPLENYWHSEELQA